MNRMAVLCIIDENVNNLMTVASLVFMRSCHYFAANELRKQMGGFIYTFSHFLVDNSLLAQLATRIATQMIIQMIECYQST